MVSALRAPRSSLALLIALLLPGVVMALRTLATRRPLHKPECGIQAPDAPAGARARRTRPARRRPRMVTPCV